MAEEAEVQQAGEPEKKKLGRRPIFESRMIPDSYQIPAQTLGRLRRVARGLKTSKASLLRQAIERILEEHKQFWQD